MTKNLLTLAGIVTLITIPKTLSNYVPENIQEIKSKTNQIITSKNNHNSEKTYLSQLNEDLEMKQRALNFLEERKESRKEIYQRYCNEIKTLKHERDSIYKIIFP